MRNSVAAAHVPNRKLITCKLPLAAGVLLNGHDPQTLLSAIHSLNTPAVQTVLADFATSPIVSFQSIGLTAFLERSQPGSIAKLTQLWPSISKDPGKSYVLSALRDSFRPLDAESVYQLAALANGSSTSADLRSAAVNALAAIHTREALPFLSGLLLSSDPRERMKGVFGLSSFANGCPAQTPANVASLAYLQIPASGPYQTKETRDNFAFRSGSEAEETSLVRFWSSWWTAHPELH